MSRKFLYTLHGLICNYSAGTVTHLLYSTSSGWSFVGNITVGTSGNLASITTNLQGSRVLFASYNGNAIVPLNYGGVTWTPGTPVSGGTDVAAVTMSDDGLHALSGGDFETSVTPYEFNTLTGLWIPQSTIPIASMHTLSVMMTRDAARAFVVPKYDDLAFPMTRNTGTGLWSVDSGYTSGIALNSSSERFFSVGFAPNGLAAIIGSNQAGVNSNGMIYNGSNWVVSSIPVALFNATWRLDGLSAIGGNGEGESGFIRTVNFNPNTGVFTAGQTISGYSRITAVSIANDGVGDIALATDYGANSVVPLSYSRSTGLWTAGAPIPSALFSGPSGGCLFPIW